MLRINRLVIVVILAIGLMATAGFASATITFKVDKVQTNGIYHGVPKLISGEDSRYGYEYTLLPDGTYTVTGTVTNNGVNKTWVGVDVGFKYNTVGKAVWKDFYVPAASGGKPGTASFSFTWPANSSDEVLVWVTNWDEGPIFEPYDLSNVDYVDAPEYAHTVDLGPMSDMVTVYSNETFMFGNSTLYSFV
jgi:hypothetical protein